MSTATLAPLGHPPASAPAAKRVHARRLSPEGNDPMNVAIDEDRELMRAPSRPSAASLLKAASKGPGKAKKAAGYEYDGDASQQAAEILQLKRTIDEQEREIKLKKSELRRFLDPWYHDKLRTSGYESTVRVPAGNGGDALKVTYISKYSKIPLELEEHLRGLVGAVKFDTYFKPTASLELKKEVADDPDRLMQVIEAIAEAIGPERFTAWFESTQGLYPSRSFTERRWSELGDDVNERIEAFGISQQVNFGDGTTAVDTRQRKGSEASQ